MMEQEQHRGILTALLLFARHEGPAPGREAVRVFRQALESLDTLANEYERQHTQPLLEVLDAAATVVEADLEHRSVGPEGANYPPDAAPKASLRIRPPGTPRASRSPWRAAMKPIGPQI